MPRPRKPRTVKIPLHGDMSHNLGFLAAIGNLVVNWANNESVFLAMLQLLVRGDSLTAAIIWHSQRTSRSRMELLSRLVREQVKDTAVVAEIEGIIKRFSGFSRTRNFFCHATYGYDSNQCLISANGASFPPEGDPIYFDEKKMDAATLNEIGDASVKLALFNGELWATVARLQDALGLRHIKLPQLLRAVPPDPDSHLPRDTVEPRE